MLIKRIGFSITLVFSLLVAPAMAEPIGVMERYALAADRDAMLAELIPGSDDYYFYHCLHYQTTGRLDRSETIIADWLKRHNGRPTALISSMTDRQRLLTYKQTPERTIDYLVTRFGIKLDHTPPIVKGERRFPSQFDSATIQIKRLVEEALHRNDPLKPVGMRHLAERFWNGNAVGLPISLHDFLKRVDGPYIDNLDQLVIKELAGRQPKNVRFGDVAAHQYLTEDELNAVAKKVPSVADDNPFVSAKLMQLRPSEDTDPSQQPAVRLAYLQRVEKYVRSLPQSYNDLKASATYRLLEANLTNSVYDRDLFVRYLQLPRSSPIVHPEWIRRTSSRANLGNDFTKMALLPPIGDEQPLVRVYLEHFLRDAADVSAFERYLKPDYLRRVFAETKLMSGIGNPQPWYDMLSASQRQAIRDASQLTLAVTNKTRFDADDPTNLLVDVKNIDELVIRMYEINTLAYYRTNSKPLNTDIDLDGLIATHERTIKYSQPAVVRHRESIELPEITDRGVWVVDLVGKGLRARAMVRRGNLQHVDQTNADGMLMTILDENQNPVPSARLIVGAQSIPADKDGRISIPPVAQAVNRNALITDGELTTQVSFRHLQESYSLSAGMYLDRTLVQSGGDGEILIRPRLSLKKQVIDPATLKSVSIKITATDLDGISTSKEIDDVKFNQFNEIVAPIRIPARLTNLSVTLNGELTALSNRRTTKLSATKTWDIAGIRRTSHTLDAFLTRNGDNYVIEVRGRSGETIDGATVNVSVTTNARRQTVDATLQSDENGRVNLGKLADVLHVRYGVTGALNHGHSLEMDQVAWPNAIHLSEGTHLQLPLAETPDEVAERYRLLEIRDGKYHDDVTRRLSMSRGLLTASKLASGDYRLVDLKHNRHTTVVVVAGTKFDNVVAGEIRHREVSPARPFAIESIRRDGENVKIQLSGDFAGVRVHAIGGRYFDNVSPLDELHIPLPSLSGRNLALPRCGYVSDLRLGDEYQYVLRRRYAKKYPGVMLPQPSVLLNPWETEETSNKSQSARKGEAPPPAAAAADGAMAESRKDAERQQEMAGSSDFDFQADAGIVVANVTPDKNGVVTIAADTFKDLPLLRIVAADPASMVMRTVANKLTKTPTIDLRLSKSLPVEKAMSFERAVSVVSPDEPLDLASLGSAQLQVFGSVGALMKLYQTLVPDNRLNEFQVIADWKTFDEDQKASHYARLASHELHLFLKMHDGKFFDQVVRPYLANKKEKQFIDYWLLDDDLSSWLELWRYSELNAAERALLAMRLPKAAERVRRELSERVALIEQNHLAIRQQIESALRMRTLKSSIVSQTANLALGDRAEEAMVAMEALNFDASGGVDRFYRELGESEKATKLKRRALSANAPRGGGMGGFGGGGAFFGRTAGRNSFAFYQDLDSTKQWAESHWDRVRTLGGNPSELIRVDAFWADLAEQNLESIGVSKNLLSPVADRHAALVALAMCGLPLEAGDIELPTKPETMFKPEHAVAVVTKRLKHLEEVEAGESILVGQRFERLGVKAKRGEVPPEPSEFLPGTAYRGQTVVSNPTAARRIVDVFWQIPSGSIPLSAAQATDSRTITLEPYAVQAIDYQFYFPHPGQFVHYPATVSDAGKLLAQGNEKEFNVVDELQNQEITWELITRDGSADEIKKFLADANLRDLNWLAVAHRMKEADVYQVIIETLRDANLPIADLWAYSMKHRVEADIKNFLSIRRDLVQNAGPVLRSPILDVQPIERRMHEHLEYSPLVRARIHRLGEENEILNPTFLNQYRSFVRTIGFQENIPDAEKLALSYYLLIQNRISEAIDRFADLDRDSIPTKLQYDYMAGYLAMHRGDFETAESIANRHAGHSVLRWRQRFAEMQTQLRQRRDLGQTEQLVSVGAGKPEPGVSTESGDLAVMDRQRFQGDSSEKQPEALVRVEGDSLRIDHRNTNDVTLNMYGVDLELLFSKAPFVRKDLKRIAMVRPMKTESLELDSETGVVNYPMNEDLRRQTLLVEVVAGGSRNVALYYGGELTTYVSEGFGQLQTTDAVTHQPVSTAYVKVYGRYANGQIKFHKDGYTDARGRFDYASISAGDAKGATRYAILVLSDEKGATLHDVAAPNQ